MAIFGLKQAKKESERFWRLGMVVARNASRAWFGMETATVNPDDLMDELILSVASLSLDVIPEIRRPFARI